MTKYASIAKRKLFTLQLLDARVVKIIACLTMFVDHTGVFVYSSVVLRSIGRIAFPLFCFLIAFGCTKTRSRIKMFVRLIIFGVLVQSSMAILRGYWDNTWYNVFFTLGFGVFVVLMIELSVSGTYRLQRYFDTKPESECKANGSSDSGQSKKYHTSTNAVVDCNKSDVIRSYQHNMHSSDFRSIVIVFGIISVTVAIVGVVAVFMVLNIMPIDYGLAGVLTIVAFYIALRHSLWTAKATSIAIISALNFVLLTSNNWVVQWWSLLSVPFILLFDTRKINVTSYEKYAFYIFYPFHVMFLNLI